MGQQGAQQPAALVGRLQASGAQVEILPSGGGQQVPLRAVLQRLATLQANEVWVEAGARLAGAFLAAGLVDELIVYLAPCLLGSDARGLADLPALQSLDQRLPLRFIDVRPVGDDLRITAAVQPRGG